MPSREPPSTEAAATERTAGKSADESAADPVDQLTDQPVDQLTDESVDRSVNESADEPPAPIEWGPVTYDRLRSLAFGAMMTVLGAVLLVAGTVAAAVARPVLSSVLGGSLPPAPTGDSVLLFVVVLLIGGPVSLLYLLVAYDRSTPEARSSLRSQLGSYSYAPDRYRLRWVGAGSLWTVTVGWVGWETALGGVISPLLLVFLLFLPMLAGSKGASFRLDPASATLERTHHSHERTGEEELSAMVRYRRLDLPWTTLFVTPYRGNAWLRSSPWLLVPSEHADAIETRLRWTVQHTDGPERASRTERIALVAVGSSALVTGSVFAVLGGADGGWALALLSAPVALLFLVLAARL